MKNNYKLLKTFFLTLLSITIILFSNEKVFAQGFQFDASIGSGPTFGKIHYDYKYNFVKRVSGGHNNSIFVGLSNKIKGKIFLRTEIGLNRIDYVLRINYDYNLSHATVYGKFENVDVLSFITNQRIYLCILPEFRQSYKKVDFFVNAGVLIASDIYNDFYFHETFCDDGEIYERDDITISGDGSDGFFGYSANGGLNLNFGTMALKLNIGSTFYNKSKLFSWGHPYIAYTNTRIALGIVYSLEK